MPGIAAAARDVDGAESVRRDRPGEGERALGRRVEILDDEQRAVAGVGGRRNGGSSGAQAASDPPVVAPHAEHRDDEHRDRDRHEPRALGELRPDHDHRDETGRRRTDGVHGHATAPARRPDAQPVAHHPRLRQREGREDADHVEVDQAVGVRLVDDEQGGRCAREHEHPVREDEPVAEVRELARREAVAREQRREPREALERRVRREHEDQQRRPLDGVVHEAAEGAGREHRARDLRDDRVRRARHRVDVHREVGDAEEHRDRDRPEHREGRRRVLSLRVPERVDAVRDRLHSGQSGRARRERAQQDEHRDHSGSGRERVRHDRLVDVSGQRSWKSPTPTRTRIDVTNAYVGSAKSIPDSRTPRRLASTITTRQRERQSDLVRGERRGERRDGIDPGRDRDSDGEDVVGQQRRGRDEARRRAEVLARHDVRAAARLVHAHRLPVGEDDDPEQARDRDRDREDEMRRGRPRRRRARRAPTPSRTRPTRAGRTRRSAARATSAAASRASGRCASAGRRAPDAGASARGASSSVRVAVLTARAPEHARQGAAQIAGVLVVERAVRFTQQPPEEEHAAGGHGTAVEHPRLEPAQHLLVPAGHAAPQRRGRGQPGRIDQGQDSGGGPQELLKMVPRAGSPRRAP